MVDKNRKLIGRGKAPIKLSGIDEKTMQMIKRKGMKLQIYYGLINGIKFLNLKDWRYMSNKIRYYLGRWQ